MDSRLSARCFNANRIDQIIAEGVRRGEHGVNEVFEKITSQLLNNKLSALVKAEQVAVLADA